MCGTVHHGFMKHREVFNVASFPNLFVEKYLIHFFAFCFQGSFSSGFCSILIGGGKPYLRSFLLISMIQLCEVGSFIMHFPIRSCFRSWSFLAILLRKQILLWSNVASNGRVPVSMCKAGMAVLSGNPCALLKKDL